MNYKQCLVGNAAPYKKLKVHLSHLIINNN